MTGPNREVMGRYGSVWISRLIRDGSGRVVRSVLEFAEDSKSRTTKNTGDFRALLDDAAVRESYGSDQVKESVGEPSAGAPAAPIRGKKLHTPDLSAMPTLDNFIRGSAADDGKLKATLSVLKLDMDTDTWPEKDRREYEIATVCPDRGMEAEGAGTALDTLDDIRRATAEVCCMPGRGTDPHAPSG
ncbi:hypothetical protein [Nocardia fusca]|uniref:hypothetical protein n=1 Tax=Nocardia fusca TaxID=941183 RepID=UPI0012F480E3|nr:hypothetical protein [Nocardia fusca]